MPTAAPSPRRFLRAYLAWSLLLAAAHVALNLSWSTRNAPKPLKDLVAFASESSLVTWTSVVAMFAVGLACVAIGRRDGARGWTLSGAFFVYLSMDDGAMLHERLAWLTGMRDGVVYSWTFLVLPAIALFGAAAFFQLWRGTRGRAVARRALLGAFALWGLAVLCELAEKPLAESGLRWRGFPVANYQQLLEEWVEMLAPGVLLAGLITLLANEREDVRVDA
ncbi:MAG: hypothetical protein R3F34_10115 [Planctomycetota bacterium]